MLVRSVVSQLSKITDSFKLILFPRFCEKCKISLIESEKILCNTCILELPFTNFQLKAEDNKVEQVFWGRVDIYWAYSLFHYTKDGLIQHLIHQFKYHGNLEIANWMVSQLNKKLSTEMLKDIDYVIPVPLHKKKLLKRGFNQSEIIGVEICKKYNLQLDSKSLFRKYYSKTQTKKHRFQRWENVEGKFFLKHANHLSGSNVLLIDDIITTGATIEACCMMLKTAGVNKISILSLAFTSV